MLSDLTICMPSHRDLLSSRDAIESAIAFSGVTGCRVVISDNSGDPRKAAAFAARSDRLTYPVQDHDDPTHNVLSSLSHVTTRFVMPMGDDDTIRIANGIRPLDLSTVAADVTAIRPQTEIWAAEIGVAQVETFTIDSTRADQRMLEFNRKAVSNNSLYYSAYRADIFLNVVRLFAAAHPTKGGYCDWALTYAFVASGRVLHDPAIIYRYDFGRWSRRETLEQAKAALFSAAGLPPEAEDFTDLLMFLDVYVLLASAQVPIGAGDRDAALAMNGRLALAAFVGKVRTNPDRYAETVRYLIDLIAGEDALNTIFVLSLMVADCLQPGLKDRYVAYYQTATAAATPAV